MFVVIIVAEIGSFNLDWFVSWVNLTNILLNLILYIMSKSSVILLL
jgi:hypothetical protein